MRICAIIRIAIKMKKCFEGKKALVVGGSGGIGASLSLLLAKNGAELVVHGGHKSEKFSVLMEKIKSHSPKSSALVFPIDAEHFSAVEDSALCRTASECDILCVCFGPFVQKPVEQTSFSDWQMVSLLDYALPGFLVTKALPWMQKNHWGRILLFGGTGTAHRGEFKTNVAYAGAKSALNVLVQSVAAQFASEGITCNAVFPGMTQTEYTQNSDALSQKMPLGSLIAPESVAESALYLLQGADLNGVLLRVDRGWSPAISK